MTRIVEKLFTLLNRHVTIPEEDAEVYRYGIDLFVYTCLSTLGLMTLGWIAGMLEYTVVIVATCYLNQTFGGGSHAKTHLKCFLTMVIGLFAGLSICELWGKSQLLFAVGVIACVMLLILPVVLHENKYYLQKNIFKYNRRMRLIVLSELLILTIAYLAGGNVICVSLSVGLMLSALSRTVAFILPKVSKAKQRNVFG